jgi:hypothetical protein
VLILVLRKISTQSINKLIRHSVQVITLVLVFVSLCTFFSEMVSAFLALLVLTIENDTNSQVLVA